MHIVPTPQGNIELSDAEWRVVDTIVPYWSMDRMSIITALKTYCNAEKVLRVLELRGDTKPHASYTLYPIIANIGDRTAEQYIADVDAAVNEFNAMYRKYASGEISMAEYERYLARK